MARLQDIMLTKKERKHRRTMPGRGVGPLGWALRTAGGVVGWVVVRKDRRIGGLGSWGL